jgi:CHAT domain-containing protein/Flp pilus assembly protein TadD
LVETRPVPLIFLLLSALLYGQTDFDHSVQALERGDYAVAIEKATEAAKRSESSGDKSGLGAALNVIGAANLYRGDYQAALPFFDRAVELARETHDGMNEVRRLNNIGNIHFFLGRYAQAFATYQEALKRLSASAAEPWYNRSQQLTLTNLAVLHLQLGQNQRALDIYQQVLALPGSMRPSDQAQVLTNLAITYRRLGDPHKALARYRDAQALLAQDPNAAATLYTLHNIGVVLALDLGDLQGALRTFKQALTLAEKSGSKREAVLEHLFLGETSFRLNQMSEASTEFEKARAGAEALHLVDERWTALYGLGRTTRLVAVARQRFREALSVIESVRTNLSVSSLKADFLADKRDVYDALISELLSQRDPPVAEIFQRIEEGRARNLKELLPGESKAVSLEQVRAALPADTTLLEYWVGQGRIAVVWATSQRTGVWTRLLDDTQTAKFERLARSLEKRGSSDWRALAAEASSYLFDPSSMPLDSKRWVIVPDGVLHTVPFEVLQVVPGKSVLENYDVSYLPSAHFLKPQTSNRRGVRWPWQQTIAAFADPAEDPNGLYSWTRLASSAAEARDVASSLPGKSTLHTGADNLKKYVFEPVTSRTPVLHFATHAAVDTMDSRRSRMLFTTDPKDPGSQYLFWNEIAKLNLHQVEMVTLAACESERGRYVRGEGVENFGRAFLGAGAGSAVSSLWRVSDQATAELMKRFYANLASGDTKAAALRKAKLAFVQSPGEVSHPYFWAAFLLSGDGHTSLTYVIRWWQIALAATLLITGLALGWRSRQGSTPAR